ncbi:hypothetical protein CR513_17936, partial [Mucuna pruriens]
MGTGYSHNLGSDCTSFEAGSTGASARWGDHFEVSMGHRTEDNTEIWSVGYKHGKKKREDCGYQLRATRDNNGIAKVSFGIDDNGTVFLLNITRVGRDGLRGGITGITSKRPQMFFTRTRPGYTIETTIVPCGCSDRDGLFVLEMKKKVNSVSAYMVTMAHYYLTDDIGLSVTAKIRYKKGNGFVVEVEGPISHPSDDLHNVIVQTRRTGIWSPDACPHCNGADSQGEEAMGQIVKPIHSSNIRGLVNSTGTTAGSNK